MPRRAIWATLMPATRCHHSVEACRGAAAFTLFGLRILRAGLKADNGAAGLTTHSRRRLRFAIYARAHGPAVPLQAFLGHRRAGIFYAPPLPAPRSMSRRRRFEGRLSRRAFHFRRALDGLMRFAMSVAFCACITSISAPFPRRLALVPCRCTAPTSGALARLASTSASAHVVLSRHELA